MLLALFTALRNAPVPARALAAGATAWLLCLALGPLAIRELKRLKVGERTEKTPIEDAELRRRIESKSGTPTMGGVFLVGGFLAGCLLWCDLRNVCLGVALASAAALAALGAVDDQLKLRGRGHGDRGLKVRYKLLIQAAIGAPAAVVIARRLGDSALRGVPLSPVSHLHPTALAVGIAFAAWGAFVLATMSNATNVTDGLDGLLAGLAALAAGAVGVACWAAGNAQAAARLGVAHVPAAGELAVLCGALCGACLGFLWFNRHPARVFMGNTGSMAIGGGLAVAAIVARQEAVLALTGVVFLAEFGSSLLQIASFRLCGFRILPVAPLHHIFEKQGHPETRIVRGFYLCGAAAALAGLNWLRLFGAR
jgi:phospho-N-acetylmuramoyl-pentapeptide-transferase